MTRPVDMSPLPPAKPAKPATTAATSQGTAKEAQTSAASAAVDAVSLSSNGRAAQLMAQGASSSSPNPALDQIAKDIASGIYRPPPKAVADALVRFEISFLKGKP